MNVKSIELYDSIVRFYHTLLKLYSRHKHCIKNIFAQVRHLSVLHKHFVIQSRLSCAA